MSACTAVANQPAATDEVEIYTAVIRQIYTVDDTFDGTLWPPLVYLVNQTDDSVRDPSLKQQPAQTLNETTQIDILAGLVDLPAEWVWVDGREAVPIEADTGRVANDGVIITLGNIQPQDDGSVQVSGSIYVANLAAGGQTYVLKQVDGTWQITGTTGPAWIS